MSMLRKAIEQAEKAAAEAAAQARAASDKVSEKVSDPATQAQARVQVAQAGLEAGRVAGKARRGITTIVEKIDPRGREYYWIGGNGLSWVEERGTDFDAVAHRAISVTPIRLDLTDFDALRELERWDFR